MWACGGFSIITDVHHRSGRARRMSTKSMLKKKFLNAEKDAFNAKKKTFDVIYTTHAQIDEHHPVDPGTSYTVVARGVADLISLMRTHTQRYARSEYHTPLSKMSFDDVLDLTAGVYFNS